VAQKTLLAVTLFSVLLLHLAAVVVVMKAERTTLAVLVVAVEAWAVRAVAVVVLWV
jgi:hypothetical protein